MTNPTHSTNLSRRSILGGLAAASAAGVIVTAPASAERLETMSLAQRMAHGLNLYRAAVDEHVASRGLSTLWLKMVDEEEFHFGIVCRIEEEAA